MSTDASLPTTARVRAPRAARASRRRFPRGRSDDALVARVRAGDERAFELVFDRYHRSLLAFCRHMLASNEEAEDALQHTFMAAYRALRASDAADPPQGLALHDRAQPLPVGPARAPRARRPSTTGHAASDGLAADVERRADLRGLLADLEQLPDEQRAALVLFELGDHSHDEIAEVLGVRREKVKALVFQARESLAELATRARDAVRRDPRAARDAARRGAQARDAAPPRRALRGLRGVRGEVRRQRAAMAGAAAGGARRSG